MTPIVYHTRGYFVRRASGDGLMVIRRFLSRHPTTVTERFLLMATVVLLPLQGNLPKFGEVSFLFIIFGVLMIYVMFCRLGALTRILRHPVLLAGFALIGVGLLMEAVHASAGYPQIRSYFLMFMGVALIASLCRDRRALRSGLYGILLSGLWVSGSLFLTVYNDLSSAVTTDFIEASRIRSATSNKSFIKENWNTVAFFAAQGAVVALALGLAEKTRLRHYVFLAIGAFCAVATFLPMSRGAVLNLVASTTAILYTHGLMRARGIRIALILIIVIPLCVPEAVYNRFIITSEDEVIDGRTRGYKAIISHLPEYFLTGVGVSHFYGDWGLQSNFRHPSTFRVVGAHNIIAQLTIFWGLLALLAVLMLVWQAYRCLPRCYSPEPLSLGLLGIGVSMMVYSFFVHNLENKEFAIALGLLTGASHWVWPRVSA